MAYLLFTIVVSRSFGEEQPTWSVRGLVTRLKEFREADQPKGVYGVGHRVLGINSWEMR